MLSVKTSLDTKRPNPDLVQGKKNLDNLHRAAAPFCQLLMGARATGQPKAWDRGLATGRQEIPAGGLDPVGRELRRHPASHVSHVSVWETLH